MKNVQFPIKISSSTNLIFKNDNSTYSNNYQDIYFQPNIGLEEKEHVFIAGNNLPNNWQNKDNFTIAETGFGTGLNFLATMRLWANTRKEKQQLHYVSCELHPLNKQQLQQALLCFPELDEFTQQLIASYPQHLFYGFHRIHFAELNLTLTLIIGDCVDAFEQLQANVDAWYLDGFAPSKNSQMWSQPLFHAIANLSHQGATLATYTVAGKIRQGLSEVGFEINKVKGFGQKREMLTAKLVKEKLLTTKQLEKQPWAQTFKATKQLSFTILGAGIAGLTIAQKLHKQGKNVTLIDRQKQPCLETSGNPQAMIMPAFTLNDSIEARFYLSAFLYAIKHYPINYYHQVGVHELAFTDKQRAWQDKLLCNFDLPNALVRKYQAGMLFSSAGWLDTQGYAQSVFKMINNYLQVEITKITSHNNQWHLYTENNLAHTTDVLILANGINLKKLFPDYQLPIVPKHGEISYFNSIDSDPQISDCPHIQLNNGYITPSWKGQQAIGASFDPLPNGEWYKKPQTTQDHWEKNKELWINTPYFDLLNNITSNKARAGIRVTTPDHLPICGAIINQNQFAKDYHDICHGKHWKQYPLPQPMENLYLLTGLGSRGFTSAPLLAEFLCNQILGHPQVLNKQLQNAINPNRFLFKHLKKN